MNAKLALSATAVLLAVSGFANAATTDLAAGHYQFKGEISASTCTPYGLLNGAGQSGDAFYKPYTPKKGTTAAVDGSLLIITNLPGANGPTTYYCAAATNAPLNSFSTAGANCYSVATAFGAPQTPAPTLSIGYGFSGQTKGGKLAVLASGTNPTGAYTLITSTASLPLEGSDGKTPCTYSSKQAWILE